MASRTKSNQRTHRHNNGSSSSSTIQRKVATSTMVIKGRRVWLLKTDRLSTNTTSTMVQATVEATRRIDLPLLQHAGLAVAPPNAHAEVRAMAHHVTAARGGEGAARECCDLLLMAAGRYADALAGHLHTLDAR